MVRNAYDSARPNRQLTDRTGHNPDPPISAHMCALSGGDTASHIAGYALPRFGQPLPVAVGACSTWRGPRGAVWPCLREARWMLDAGRG